MKKLISKKTKSIFRELPVKLISRKMGCDRGTPIDRYYIEKFLSENKYAIKGTVMEIAERTYTEKFGIEVSEKLIFTADEKAKDAIIGDLTTGEGCKSNMVDCFILTQTIPFIYEFDSAIANVIKMLKPGGVALFTLRGISMISEYDAERWGDYWGFTKQSAKRIFEKYVSENNIEVISYGNAKIATAFLYGLSQEEIEMKDYLYNDDLVPIIIGVKIKKE
ncbi:MAG: class I SAM-dependent methyltransferase [Lachnospiraceae bacterium]|nr:class I SAM-dependent methyltransferase [Lachnospiraceae bacterium]